MWCLPCVGPKVKTIKVFKTMTFDEFYDTYYGVLIPQSVSKKKFLYANRYRRLFERDIIKQGNCVTVPRR